MSTDRVLSKFSWESDDYFFRKDDVANDIYLIQQGTVEVFDIDSSGKEKRVKLIAAGHAFGEEALLPPAKRKFSARAMNDVICVAVNCRLLEKQMEKEDPFIAALFRILQSNMQSVSSLDKISTENEINQLTSALSMREDDEDLPEADDPFK